MERLSRIGVCTVAVFLMVVVLIVVTVSAESEVLFMDEFKGDLSKWTFVENGIPAKPGKSWSKWKLGDGVLVYDKPKEFCPGDAFIVAEWEDFTVEVEVMVTSSLSEGWVRIQPRMSSPWDGYSVDIAGNGTAFFAFDGTFDAHRPLRNQLKNATFKGIKQNVRYTIRLSMEGYKIKVYVDGELVAIYEDPEKVHPTGGLGIRAENAALEIYKVVVYKGVEE